MDPNADLSNRTISIAQVALEESRWLISGTLPRCNFSLESHVRGLAVVAQGFVNSTG